MLEPELMKCLRCVQGRLDAANLPDLRLLRVRQDGRERVAGALLLLLDLVLQVPNAEDQLTDGRGIGRGAVQRLRERLTLFLDLLNERLDSTLARLHQFPNGSDLRRVEAEDLLQE